MSDSADLSLMLDGFRRIKPLSIKEEEAISESADVVSKSKKTVLVKEGQAHTNSYFVLKGCVREFSQVNGEEYTSRFYTEGEWIIAEGSPAICSLVCTEDCTFVAGNEAKAKILFETFPGLETISRKLVESSFIESQKNQVEFRSLSPEERYLKVLETRPSLLQRVPLYLIADYLGIKPESLSRIRKRLANN